MLVEYVRDNNGQKCGAVVAVDNNDGTFGVGWSACNAEMDNFDKDRALKIALGRAHAGSKQSPRNPIVANRFLSMLNKAQHYYQNPRLRPSEETLAMTLKFVSVVSSKQT